MNLATVAKFIAALIAALTSILTLNLLPDEYSHWVSGAIAVLGAISVYLVPNADPVVEPAKADALKAIDEAGAYNPEHDAG